MARQSRRNVFVIAVLVAFLAIVLSGCGDFRQQALEAQARLNEAVEQAQLAEQAAAQNAARILELGHRIDALEAQIVALQEASSEE